MTGRPSVNKRQRELLRKERRAEKLSRRDERRLKRGVDNTESPLAPASAEVDEASLPPADSVEVK